MDFFNPDTHELIKEAEDDFKHYVVYPFLCSVGNSSFSILNTGEYRLKAVTNEMIRRCDNSYRLSRKIDNNSK
jgi:hypothetical protein